MDLSIIWITRISDQEDQFLNEYLDYLSDINAEKIIVGHTDLCRSDFKYIPFFEHGLDALGLICHKKNIGVLAASRKYCLVLHADCWPDKSFFENLQNLGEVDDFTAICPLANTQAGRGLTWCNYAGQHKDQNEPPDNRTYISGGAILGSKNLFLYFPWNQNLCHNQEEDYELSQRMLDYGAKLKFEPSLIINMKYTQ